ncbi:hypothetical protein FRC03_009890, partial [Tulasnella sp. 419]
DWLDSRSNSVAVTPRASNTVYKPPTAPSAIVINLAVHQSCSAINMDTPLVYKVGPPFVSGGGCQLSYVCKLQGQSSHVGLAFIRPFGSQPDRVSPFPGENNFCQWRENPPGYRSL